MAEQRRDPLLEPVDRRVLAELVVADLGAAAIASRIAGVGRVTVSERRSMTGPAVTAEAYDDERVGVGSRRCPPITRSSAATCPTPRGARRRSSSRRPPGPLPPGDRRAATSRRSRPARSTIPAWFWGAAADDLGLAWQRRPDQVARPVSGGPEWARWWIGGAFNYAAAAVDPRAARDPDGEAIAWEGEDGDGPAR